LELLVILITHWSVQEKPGVRGGLDVVHEYVV
jgi:hypothetical protein